MNQKLVEPFKRFSWTIHSCITRFSLLSWYIWLWKHEIRPPKEQTLWHLGLVSRNCGIGCRFFTDLSSSIKDTLICGRVLHTQNQTKKIGPETSVYKLVSLLAWSQCTKIESMFYICILDNFLLFNYRYTHLLHSVTVVDDSLESFTGFPLVKLYLR